MSIQLYDGGKPTLIFFMTYLRPMGSQYAMHGNYYCGVFNSNRSRAHCIKETHPPYKTRTYRNSVHHKYR